jgi:hypothetical protein
VRSGLALSRRGRRRNHVVILLVTAFLSSEDIAADLSQCCWHFVRK